MLLDLALSSYMVFLFQLRIRELQEREASLKEQLEQVAGTTPRLH